MSWGEVYKINNNMKKPLNEQLRDARFIPIRLFTATGNYTPEKTGIYKIICVGNGGNGYAYANSGAYGCAAGGGGGVGIKTMKLVKGTNYPITVGTTASFGNYVTATAGANAQSYTAGGAGGTASGGDYNFTGEKGKHSGTGVAIKLTGGSVGVILSEFYRTCDYNYNSVVSYPYGDSILSYGAGGGAYGRSILNGNIYNETRETHNGLPAAVLIIPLEMEE